MSYPYYRDAEGEKPPVTNPKTKSSPTFTALQEIFAEVTGVDLEEITPASYLEEFHPSDMPSVVIKINHHFGVRLNPKQVMADCETIDELVALIEDEQELG